VGFTPVRLELWVDESLKKNEVVVVENGVAGRRVNMSFAYTFMNHYAGVFDPLYAKQVV
jgi:prolyl-tRNA editing enzyme YbaK/EbsC (Cys-tRNA(Pro) deacylase)